MREVNVDRLLEEYFLLTRDVSTATPFSNNPGSSRVPNSGISRAVAVLCDVGVCLGKLSPEHFNVIHERWSLWLAREDADEMVTRWSSKMVSAMKANRRGAYVRAKKQQKSWRDSARRLTSEITNIDRRPAYKEAINRLSQEVTFRKLVERWARMER